MQIIKNTCVSISKSVTALMTSGIAAAVILVSQSTIAAPLSAQEIMFTQPDGTVIFLNQKTDKAIRWEEDGNGYSVVKFENRYYYARKGENGQLEPTQFIVGEHNPELWGLARHISPSAK